MKKIIFFIGIFMSITFLSAQDFGEISETNLKMEKLQEDPEANAVYLVNNAEIYISPQWELKMEFHKRIKILTEKGKDLANIKIIYWHEDDIEDLEAVCYTPDGEEIELDDDNIFEEDSDRFKTKTFAIPGVEIGSIIEYRYTMYSKYISNLEPFYFQAEEYTKFSKLTVMIPAGFNFSAFLNNADQYDFTENKESINNPLNPRKKALRCIWTAKNLPGIKKEPNMTAVNDYYCKVLFQLQSYDDGRFSHDFVKKWSDISTHYFKLFDEFTEDNSLEDFTKKLVAGIEKKEDQLKKIYSFVVNDIKTSDANFIYSKKFKSPEEIINSKEATKSEKNILFINMVKRLGFDAYPVLISSRSHGKLDANWVSTSQFNRVISYVNFDRKQRFVNPTVKHCPFGVLIPSYNVGKGLIVREEKGSIIKVKSKNISTVENASTEFTLNEKGDLIGSSEISFSGYFGISVRDQIEENKTDFFEDYLKNDAFEIVIDSTEVENFDDFDKPLKSKIQFHIKNFIDPEESTFYVEIPELHKLKKNIFVRDKRSFPVDFPFTHTNLEKISFKIPDYLTLTESPSSINKNMRKVFYTKSFSNSGNELKIRRSFKVKKPSIFPKEYPYLKQLYSIIVEKDQEQIVLSKSNQKSN